MYQEEEKRQRDPSYKGGLVQVGPLGQALSNPSVGEGASEGQVWGGGEARRPGHKRWLLGDALSSGRAWAWACFCGLSHAMPRPSCAQGAWLWSSHSKC